MNNQEYEQNLQERWEDLHSLGDSKPSAKECFDYAFAAAYALGKQEKDAEGEEMLKVSRKQVQNLYNYHKSRGHHLAGESLIKLFGSKCLPDEAAVAENATTTEPKSAEPKFKYSIGQKVKSIYADEVLTIKEHCGRVRHDNVYKVEEYAYTWNECELRPYTEPDTSHETPVCENHSDDTSQKEANVNSNRNLSKDCDKQFDNILKDSFRNGRRLNIATTIMAGVMANPNIIKSRDDLRAISDEWLTSRTLELADTLISKCEEGGSDGN